MLVKFLLFALFLTTLRAAPAQTGKAAVHIVFRNMAGSQKMQIGNTYQNAFGEDYTIRNFKYFISDISFTQADGTTTPPAGSFLVNEADSNSTTLTVDVSPGRFTAISFLIGVDSIYNVSGTQTGALDPATGMFWTWNSGYVAAKLEAMSSVSAAPNNNVTFHIGGFRTGQNVSRQISLPLNVMPGNAVTEIIIAADSGKWFDAVHPLKIADHSVCSTPGQLAVLYADNYAKMFTLVSAR